MSKLKKCSKCDVELVVGENWWASNAKNKTYNCNPCHVQKSVKWQTNNPEKFRKNLSKYQKKNPSRMLANAIKSRKKRLKLEGKGVYLVKYRWINFYVGEGWFLDRREKHLGGNSVKLSKVVKLRTERNLNRKYLSFHVLEYLDDKPTMLKRERHYRRELKPYINPLD